MPPTASINAGAGAAERAQGSHHLSAQRARRSAGCCRACATRVSRGKLRRCAAAGEAAGCASRQLQSDVCCGLAGPEQECRHFHPAAECKAALQQRRPAQCRCVAMPMCVSAATLPSVLERVCYGPTSCNVSKRVSGRHKKEREPGCLAACMTPVSCHLLLPLQAQCCSREVIMTTSSSMMWTRCQR